MYLGIDIGTSAVKALVVDKDQTVLATSDAPLKVSQPQAGWSEQSPEDWWATTQICCSKLAQLLGARWGDIQAIGLSGQMHGAVLLNAHHKVLRPAILWNDGRSAPQCDEMNAALGDIETTAGITAMPGFTAPKVLWCAQNEPEIHHAIAHILLPKDYVGLCLTGEMATDMADAAGTLWLNQKLRQWDDSLCAASATDPVWLPKLHEGTQITGGLSASAAESLALKAGIPVAAGGGDAAAGALGIGAVNEGDAFVSLGTSGQLFVANERYKPAPQTAVHCYAHCVPDRWFQMAAMLNGASPMSWLADFLSQDIASLLTKAEAASDAPLFLPYLTGERTPHNDANIRGSFYGLTPSTDGGSAMRSVVDAIAYTFCDARECLEQAGSPISTVAAIGGGSRSNFVLQTMSDAMDVTIQRYVGSETGPALGAARLAMVATGNHTLAEVALKPAFDRAFTPRANQAANHAQRLEQWRAMYRALQPLSLAKFGKTP
ncbi:xylulokinase [Pseudahrensia aquimaris]|uniref:Xylulose kinase n=1 Tax=Pseudahrensia aquimaris TaxID=744461 RepID=A0ABW3FIL9_9HYPH